MNKTDIDTLDQRVRRLEARLPEVGEPPLTAVLDEVEALVADLLRHYAHVAKGQTLEGDDLLTLLRQFLKGDPSLNAVRDNVREIVYYRNCLASGREDALPARAARMAVRTAAHIHLYLRTRLEQQDLA